MSGNSGPTRTLILKASAAQTASTAGPEIVIPSHYTRMRAVLSITARTGTSPTLDVYIQNGLNFPAAADIVGGRPSGTLTWNDLIHFTQATATGVQYATFIEATGDIGAAQDVALAASEIRAGVIGERLRYKSVIGGTNPSFTFSVFIELLP